MHKDRYVASNLKFKDDDTYITSTQISELTEVESLDECCFAMSYELWQKVKFDEYVCNHWHLYAVEFCYNARKICQSKSYVMPLDAYHNNRHGVARLYADNHFLRSLKRLITKHKDVNKMIFTPCYIVSTSFLRSSLKLMRTRIKNLLR